LWVWWWTFGFLRHGVSFLVRVWFRFCLGRDFLPQPWSPFLQPSVQLVTLGCFPESKSRAECSCWQFLPSFAPGPPYFFVVGVMRHRCKFTFDFTVIFFLYYIIVINYQCY
jgi:hypothetical protein